MEVHGLADRRALDDHVAIVVGATNGIGSIGYLAAKAAVFQALEQPANDELSPWSIISRPPNNRR